MMNGVKVDSPGSEGLFCSDYFCDDIGEFDENDLDSLVRTTQVCSHKHICNPTTGPDNTHTHTCEHTHTHTIASGDEEKLVKKKRPAGNREAVKKYRENVKTKKANLEDRNAVLEKENSKIPELVEENKKLRKTLQQQGPTQAALIYENKRLKTFLCQMRRSIDMEFESINGGYCNEPAHLPSGNYLTSGPCATPLPCYVLRPAAQAGVMDFDQMESVGWHAECENTNTICYDPESDPQWVSHHRAPFDGDKSTKKACKPPGSLKAPLSDQ